MEARESQMRLPEVVEALEQARSELDEADINDLDIPRIVVIGDQGTGKSSLLSALTKLQLPTGDGTTTRAPLKIFIKPGPQQTILLKYRLRTATGLQPTREVRLSAEDLEQRPRRLADAIMMAQREMRHALLALSPETRLSYGVGDLEGEHWLLRDEIELDITRPEDKRPIVVVDLPGLHRPNKDVRKLVEEFIESKIRGPNTVILSAEPARSAVDGGPGTNLAFSANLAEEADPKLERTLTILTKADEPTDVVKVLEAALKKTNKQGCVLVATHPFGGLSEDAALAMYTSPAPDVADRCAQLREAMKAGGSGFGIPHLVDRLAKLQESMVHREVPQLIKKLKAKMDELQGELQRCGQFPATEKEADHRLDEVLRDVEKRFQEGCTNTALWQSDSAPGPSGRPLPTDVAPDLMWRIRQAANEYAGVQSYFIPGILGKKVVLQTVLKGAALDEAHGHPELLGERISVNLFNEFHRHVEEEAFKFIKAAEDIVKETLLGIITEYLPRDFPDQLKNMVITAADEQLLEVVEELRKSVEVVTRSYTRIVEPLHDEVVYMTYQRMFVIASGILQNAYDKEAAKALHYGDGVVPKSQQLDPTAGDAHNSKDQNGGGSLMEKALRLAVPGEGKGGANGDGSSSGMGRAVGGITALALSPVLGPIAGPVGIVVGEFSNQVWKLSRELLLRYKEDYAKKKADRKADKGAKPFPADYREEDYQPNLVPLPWPAKKDPMTAFELMCKMMNCDPSYVVVALDFYFKEFEAAIQKSNKGRKYGADELQRHFIATLCRMMCSHHPMTESVAKLVRLRLLSTHNKDKDALPVQLGLKMLQSIRKAVAAEGGRMVALLVDQEQLKQKEDLEAKLAAVQKAHKRLTAVHSW